jgi:hypothetical protein
VVLTTTSPIEEIYPQIEEVVKARKFVISTCEEPSFPWDTSPDLSQKIIKVGKPPALPGDPPSLTFAGK